MPETKNILLRLDPTLAAQLQAVADIEQRPISDVVREAIRELVASRRKDKRFQQRLNATLKDQQRVLRQLKGDER